MLLQYFKWIILLCYNYIKFYEKKSVFFDTFDYTYVILFKPLQIFTKLLNNFYHINKNLFMTNIFIYKIKYMLYIYVKHIFLLFSQNIF